MNKEQIKLDIGDFLGFVDLTGDEALTSDKVDELESLIQSCQDVQKDGDDLVPNAIYDRLMEILSKNKPDSELIGRIWEDAGEKKFDESDKLFLAVPMYSIQTIKSLSSQDFYDFLNRLPDELDFHASLKLNGWGIRVVYKDGKHFKSRTRARSSSGRDITPQMNVVLYQDGIDEIDDISNLGYVEVRGELVVSFDNFEEAKKYKNDLRSPFTAVSAMVRDSATKEEWGLLHFIAYKFIAEGFSFSTKEEEYEYLSELGFEVPMYWTPEGVDTTSLDDFKSIIVDCEEDAKSYEYYTDGVVLEVNDTAIASSLGQGNGNYNNYNVALKVGKWKQDLYSGYVQTILWMKGKSKMTPVAIVSSEEDQIEFEDGNEHMYVTNKNDIANLDDLGVITASSNRVKRVPLYEPCNILALNAWRGNIIHFRYGGEAGVLPCYSDGTPLTEGRVQEILEEV